MLFFSQSYPSLDPDGQNVDENGDSAKKEKDDPGRSLYFK